MRGGFPKVYVVSRNSAKIADMNQTIARMQEEDAERLDGFDIIQRRHRLALFDEIRERFHPDESETESNGTVLQLENEDISFRDVVRIADERPGLPQ